MTYWIKYWGDNPLLKAVNRDDLEGVTLCLKEGADISTKDNRGYTALHLAAINGQTAIVELLLEKSADITREDNEGYTALHLAAINGQTAMVEFLLKKGAAITTENYQGETALHFATQFDHRATVALLLDLGADITAKNKKGWTPLHFAALEGYTTMVELLLKEGADITEKQNEGLTALHLVNWEYTTSQLLLEYNAGLLYMSDDEKRKTLRDLNSTQLKALSLSAIEILYPHPSKKNIYITTVAELSAVLSPEEKLALAYKWPKGASKCTFMPEGVREITKQALSERRAIRQAAEYFCYFEELNKGKNNENDQLQKKQETESLRKQQESPFPFYSYYNQLPKDTKHIICTLATGAVREPNDGELIKIKFGIRS